jgi:uncharacterized protein
MPHFLSPFLDSRESFGLRIERTGANLVDVLETAFDSASRRRGLLGRNGLPVDRGLVIAPCQAVHTFAMRFPIDIVAVSRDGRVLKITASVPPRRIAIAWSAFAVIELAAGVCERIGLVVDDRLTVVSTECEHPHAIAQTA